MFVPLLHIFKWFLSDIRCILSISSSFSNVSVTGILITKKKIRDTKLILGKYDLQQNGTDDVMARLSRFSRVKHLDTSHNILIADQFSGEVSQVLSAFENVG